MLVWPLNEEFILARIFTFNYFNVLISIDEAVETDVKLVKETKIGFMSTTFIHTQLFSMNAKYRLKRLQ